VLDTLVTRVEGELDAGSIVEGRVVIEAGARLVGSRVRGPAVIGAGTVLTNSYVGPYSSVAERCEITDSEVENSVVLAESRIVGIPRLADSLLGRNTEVLRSGLRPTATRLMLGDHSHVDLE
jgi:glucose-1-phosphate thymidylyltransferase